MSAFTSTAQTLVQRMCLLLGVAMLLTLGLVPLFDLDEGAFAQATTEMLRTGQFAATTLNGEPRYDKPIGIYWLQAASVATFGSQEWAFRLPSSLAVILWALVLWRFLRPRMGVDTANWATLMLLGSLGPSIIAQAATADALLNLLITLALLDIYRNHENPTRALRLRVYLWLALGFLVKGPVAVAIPMLTSGLYYLSTGRGRHWVIAVLEWRGWLVFLAVVTPWLLAVYEAQGWGFFAGFFGEHNIGRFTQTREGHGGSLYYYLIALPLVMLPFSALLIRALARPQKLWADPLQGFALCWGVVVFVLVSLSATQLPHYVLYATPAWVILMAAQLTRQLNWAWLLLVPTLAILVLAGLPFLLPLFADTPTRPYEQAVLALAVEELTPQSLGFAAILIVMACALALYGRQQAGAAAQRTLVLLTGLLWAVSHLLIIPLVSAAQQGPVREAGTLARQLNKPAVMLGLRMPSFSVYAGQSTPRREPMQGELALTRLDRMPAICAMQQCQTRYAKGGIRLIEVISPAPLASPPSE